MRRIVFLIVMMCFCVAGYSQDVYPLFRKCKTYKESNVAFAEEFARMYSYHLKDLKKTNKDLYKRCIGEFKNVRIMIQIQTDGSLTLKDEELKDEIHTVQYGLIKTALNSMPDWTPWQHRGHNNKLYVGIPLKHSWLE